jgi:hypothetical protein
MLSPGAPSTKPDPWSPSTFFSFKGSTFSSNKKGFTMNELEAPPPQLIEAIYNFLEMHLSEGIDKNLVAYYCYKRSDDNKFKFVGYSLADLQPEKEKGFQQFVEEGIKLRNYRQNMDCLFTVMLANYYVTDDSNLMCGYMELPFAFDSNDDPDSLEDMTKHAGVLFCYLDLQSDYRFGGLVLFDNFNFQGENDEINLLALSLSKIRSYGEIIPYTQPLTMIQGLTCGLELEKNF